MMDPFDVYKLYNALKLHFDNESYDAIKYNFKTTVNPQSFFKRRDKYFFAKLGKNQKDIQKEPSIITEKNGGLNKQKKKKTQS